MNVLFLCTANQHRSKTAEILFRDQEPAHQYKSAGLSKKYCAAANTSLCTEAMLDWADRVFVMEKQHMDRIINETGTRYLDKITDLEIPDIYGLMDESLIKELVQKVDIA